MNLSLLVFEIETLKEQLCSKRSPASTHSRAKHQGTRLNAELTQWASSFSAPLERHQGELRCESLPGSPSESLKSKSSSVKGFRQLWWSPKAWCRRVLVGTTPSVIDTEGEGVSESSRSATCCPTGSQPVRWGLTWQFHRVHSALLSHLQKDLQKHQAQSGGDPLPLTRFNYYYHYY